jgi:hypothetical protein
MLLTAYSCLAISGEYFVLTKAAFFEQTLTETSGQQISDNDNDSDVVTVWVGLKAAALNNPVSGVGKVVVQFDRFCDLRGEGIDRYLDPAQCSDCADVSDLMVICLMVAVVCFLPTFFSEQLRMYSAYDVNCVKGYVTLLGVITLALNGVVIVESILGCGSSFNTGTQLFDQQGNVLPSGTPPDEAYYVIDYTWEWGWGLIILAVATGLKLLDVLINTCVPTPNVTRDRREQEIYETIGAEDMEAIRRTDDDVKDGTDGAGSPQPQQFMQEDPYASSSAAAVPPQYPPPQQQQQQQYYQPGPPSSSIQDGRSLPGDPSMAAQGGSFPGSPTYAPYEY